MKSEEVTTGKDNSQTLPFITIVGVTLLIYVLLGESSDVFIFFILSFYVIGGIFFKIKNKHTFYISLFLCILMSLFFVANNLEIADKTATLLFFFLLTGVGQEFLNEKI